MIALYHQTKTPISFWCRQGLNPRSLIQPSETLPVELTGTHEFEEVEYVKNMGIFFYHSQLFWDPLIKSHIESRNYLENAIGFGQNTNILPIQTC